MERCRSRIESQHKPPLAKINKRAGQSLTGRKGTFRPYGPTEPQRARRVTRRVGAARRTAALIGSSMRSPDRLKRYRSLFKWVFLLSLPLLVANHAPMLSSEALPHRAYHAAQDALGPSFSVLVHVGVLIPAISLVAFVITTAIAWREL